MNARYSKDVSTLRAISKGLPTIRTALLSYPPSHLGVGRDTINSSFRLNSLFILLILRWLTLCPYQRGITGTTSFLGLPPIRLLSVLGQEMESGAQLELAFESKELRDVCENEAEAKRQLGDSVAEMLKHRLADLNAATSPRDLIAGRPRLSEDGQRMIVDICAGSYLIFAANHPKNPTTSNGDLDWGRVNRIRILGVGDDHA